MHLRFENPNLLAILPVLFVLGGIFAWRSRQVFAFSWRHLAFTVLALSLCVVALARPQRGTMVTTAQGRTGNVFLAIDISRSMLAQDISPSRLQFAVAFAQKLLQELRGVRVAIFPFAADGYLQIPLTADLQAVSDLLTTLGPSMTTNQGTDFPRTLESLYLQIHRLEAAAQERGETWATTQVILFSDGESHRPNQDDILAKFRAEKIPVFVVATGTTQGGMIPAENKWGQSRERVRDASGQPVQTRLSPETLKHLSDRTGGDFFAARFDEVYRLRSRLERSMALGRLTASFKLEKEYFPILLTLALALMLLEFGLGRWEYAVRLAPLFLALTLAGGAVAEEPDMAKDPIDTYNQALKIAEKDPQAAAQLFQESAYTATDAKVKKQALFNLGNAILKLGDPQQALQTYQQAIDVKSKSASFDREANTRISENIVLAAKILEEMKKQAQSGGDGDPNEEQEGKQGKGEDPKGPKKDYQAQKFSDEQKQKIYDLLARDEQQTTQRVQEQRNKNRPTNPNEKTW